MGQTNATKITYATLSGDGLDDVHAELDAAIERVPESFGSEHPMIIGQDRVVAAEQFEDYSPIDGRICFHVRTVASRNGVQNGSSWD